ncbi:MAG: FkbM family methyltransferase [Vicinamibacterales bacterium]
MRRFLERHLGDVAGLGTYSQQGEDAVLWHLLSEKGHGFYVDVGAHHPRRYSNTYFFYRRGWSGLNIDATPGSMKPFDLERPRDINIEAAIGTAVGPLTYYIFNEPALNGFSQTLPGPLQGSDYFRVIGQLSIVPRRLDEVLRERLSPGQLIDFMTIDVEGVDLEVLTSNDWERFRPRFVVVEDNAVFYIDDVERSSVGQFMASLGYGCCAKTKHTMIFADKTRASAIPRL